LVSVIVVVKNGEKTIRQCLDSILHQDFDKSFELIVVDGGSADGTIDIVQQYDVRLIKDHNGTIAHSRNVGITASMGKYIAFTDSDCVVERNWLKLLFNSMQSEPNIIAVGGPNLVIDADPPFGKVVGYMQGTFLGSGGSPQSFALTNQKFVYSIPNCNVMYQKRIFAEETFDDTFNVGEDCDLNYRLNQKGCSFLYMPNVIVWHHRPNDFKRFFKKMFSYGYAMGRVSRKHKKLVRWFAPLPSIALIVSLLNLLLISAFPIVVLPLLVALLIYTGTLSFSVAQVFSKYRHSKSLLVVFLLPMQHLAYAIGFLKSLFV